MQSKFTQGLSFGAGFAISFTLIAAFLMFLLEAVTEDLFSSSKKTILREAVEFRSYDITPRFQTIQTDFGNRDAYVITGKIDVLSEKQYDYYEAALDIWSAEEFYLDTCTRPELKTEAIGNDFTLLFMFECNKIPKDSKDLNFKFSVYGFKETKK